MNSDDNYPEGAADENNLTAQELSEQQPASQQRPSGQTIKIAEIQRMNIDQLNHLWEKNRPQASRFADQIANGL